MHVMLTSFVYNIQNLAVPNNSIIARLIARFCKNLRILSTQAHIISYGSAQKSMKKFKFRTYHVRSFQELKEPDEKSA